jgi:hypothetical protein
MKGGGMPDLPDTGWGGGEGEEESYMNGLTGFHFPDKTCFWVKTTLIKKKIKFSSYIRKFIMEQLQSHI